MMPKLLYKFEFLYEPMDAREIKYLTWHGMPICELAPKVTTSSHPREDVNGRIGLEKIVLIAQNYLDQERMLEVDASQCIVDHQIQSTARFQPFCHIVG